MLGKKIKKLINKNDRLYVIARCIKNINDPTYWKLVKGYYETCDYVSLLIEHKGEKYPDKIIYHLGLCLPNEKEPNKPVFMSDAGLGALLRATLLSMSFPDVLGMDPVVEWGSISVYHDPGMDSVTLNVFEYYFEPVSQIYPKEIEECKNIVDVGHSMVNSYFFMERASDLFASYHVKQEEIEKLAYLYKKYIHLNNKTKDYIDAQMSEILDAGPILAVHFRGTDFNLGLKNHPVPITVKEYLATVKQVYTDGNYEKIFLATDDINALEQFKEEFKDKLAYYKDVFRTGGHIGAQATYDDRPLHNYKLGLEILRDIYTIANCDALVCGLSQVSFAARYVNIAMNRKFRDVVVLDNGVNAEESAEAKQYRRELKKQNEKFKP